MITILFSLFVIVFTLIYGYLFDAFTLSLLSIIYWLLAFLLGFVTTFVLLLIRMHLYGRFQKGDQTKNMKNHQFVHNIMRLVTRLLRLKVHASGLKNIPAKPFIMIGNHQSNYDIIAVKPFIKNQPLIFVAKKSLFKWPVLGRLVALLGNIPINRLTDRSAIEAIVNGIKQYKSGVPVVIYPEGKRSFSNEMIDFKPGAFKLAMKPKAPILVVSIYNFHKTWQWWPFKRQNVYIHFHPLLEYEDYQSMNTQELSKVVKATIQEQLNTFKEMDTK